MKEIHDKTEKRLLDYHKFFKGQTEVFKKEADMFFNAVQVGTAQHAESEGVSSPAYSAYCERTACTKRRK